MSPNEQKMTPGRDAISKARSISSSGVTHTGQPGPWTSDTCGGSSSSSPCRTTECVCPPHTSMSTHGRVTLARIVSQRRATTVGSRYSSRNFTAAVRFGFGVIELADLLQQREHALRLGLVELGECEPDVDECVFADGNLGNVLEAYPLEDAAEIDLAHEQVVLAVQFNDLAGDAEAHGRRSGGGNDRILSPFESRRNDQLPQAQPAVARWNERVTVHPEAVTRQQFE